MYAPLANRDKSWQVSGISVGKHWLASVVVELVVVSLVAILLVIAVVVITDVVLEARGAGQRSRSIRYANFWLPMPKSVTAYELGRL